MTEPAPRRALITACAMLAVFMQTLSTIANVALPYMQGALAASQEEISWVLTSYIIAAAIMTAPTGYRDGGVKPRAFFVAPHQRHQAGTPAPQTLPWQYLYFLPEPQGQGALRGVAVQVSGRLAPHALRS